VSISTVAPDYYAVLQVHPDADQEVIEAAYRQLMKKHHPDLAGGDPRLVAEHEARAKAINEAFGVLRDPERRRRYDLDRILSGTVRAAAPQPPPSAPPPPPRPRTPPPSAPAATSREAVAATWQPQRSPWLAPLGWLSAAYYLLPGPYEWEGGRTRELTAVLLLPPLGLAAFALATGRLAPWLGHSLMTTAAAGVILALLAAIAMWGSLLRAAIATLPTVVLMTGLINPWLQDGHIPAWIAWSLLSCASLIFSARMFVFGVLPTLGIIWLIARPI
jgi:DnaJ-like protein